MDDQEMKVKKRDGKLEEISFDKILHRVKSIGSEENINLNYSLLVIKIIDQLYDGIDTTKIDELTAEHCASQSTHHLDYSTLASRIIISNHHKNTPSSFQEVTKSLFEFTDVHGKKSSLVDKVYHQRVMKNIDELENYIDYSRDYLIDYFGFKTLERAYLYRVNGKIMERPQHMWMRVAVAIHGNNLDKVKKSYDFMSQKYFTHATPTLFNAGTTRNQLSSCFLMAMEEDSIDGIYNTLKDCANISKYAGGIGLHIHNIRAKGSHIRGTNGTSNGIVPMMRVFNNTAKYVDQCLIPETILYTLQGPKQIQHVIAGETQIVNDKGKHEVIENVLEHPYKGMIYEIETMHSLFPLKITGEHPVLCLSNVEKRLSDEVIRKQIEKGTIKHDYIDAKELNDKSMIAYSIPKYVSDVPSITNEDCYFYGIMLGNGHYNTHNQTGHIELHNTRKVEVLNFCKIYLETKCVQYEISDNGNMRRIQWYKNIVLPFRHSDIYDEFKEKHVTKKWLHLPIQKSQHIIKGIIDADDCKHKELVFESTSLNLIEVMRYLLLRMGVLTSGYVDDLVGAKHHTKNGSIEHKKINYVLNIPQTKTICELLKIEKSGEFLKQFRCNDFVYTRIKNIKTSHYNGTLYDLQMKEVHNYMTNNGIVHNGGGRRNGSFAIYLEPWHADIDMFLQMRKNHGDEELKARDLFYALWIPDLFMKRVETNSEWTLMCPDECPGLSDVYGEEFDDLYVKYENSGLIKKKVNARELWLKILDSQMETGTPYLLYKDAANKKSNQKNLGTIKSSNLCTEIMEYSDAQETAVCNLASIALSTFVNKDKSFDYEKLHEVSKLVTENLNKIIDTNYYPTEKTKTSNLKHRPIGIGVQGLADTFALMDLPFESDEASEVNKLIFETIYHAAIKMSNELAILRQQSILRVKKLYGQTTIEDLPSGILEYNDIVSEEFSETEWIDLIPTKEELMIDDDNLLGSYSSFEGSPASKGILQFDLWDTIPSGKFDWDTLKNSIQLYGIRNSLLLAPMPTASTSQILGNNECFEPFTSNIYSRRTMAGEFMIVNKHLQKDLIDMNIWNETIKNKIIEDRGSIANIDSIPQHIKDKYKIVWEMSMKKVIDMSSERGAFICQSQSLNLWMENPNYKALTSMHFYGWKSGLKTGMYYLRRKAKHQAQQFTIEPSKVVINNEPEECEVCSA